MSSSFEDMLFGTLTNEFKIQSCRIGCFFAYAEKGVKTLNLINSTKSIALMSCDDHNQLVFLCNERVRSSLSLTKIIKLNTKSQENPF